MNEGGKLKLYKVLPKYIDALRDETFEKLMEECQMNRLAI